MKSSCCTFFKTNAVKAINCIRQISTIERIKDVVSNWQWPEPSCSPHKKEFSGTTREPISPGRATLLIYDFVSGFGPAGHARRYVRPSITAGLEYLQQHIYNKNSLAVMVCLRKTKHFEFQIWEEDQEGLVMSETCTSYPPLEKLNIVQCLRYASRVFDNTHESIDEKLVILLTSVGIDEDVLRFVGELLRRHNPVMEVICVGRDRPLERIAILHLLATKDADGFRHYKHVKNTEDLIEHYRELAR